MSNLPYSVLTNRYDFATLSIYVDHNIKDQQVILKKQDWDDLFEPIFRLASQDECSTELEIHTPSVLMDMRDAKIGIKESDMLWRFGENKLSTIATMNPEGHVKIPEDVFEILLDSAHVLIRSASILGTKQEKQQAENWLIKANAEYKRNTVSRFFGHNKAFANTVQSAQQKRLALHS